MLMKNWTVLKIACGDQAAQVANF